MALPSANSRSADPGSPARITRATPAPDVSTTAGCAPATSARSTRGFMQLTDRTKDVIKSGGEWISSVELENQLMATPTCSRRRSSPSDHLAGAAPGLRGAKRARGGRRGAARFLGEQVARWWLPERWSFVPEIPKTSVGKFDKKVLRARYAEGDLEVTKLDGPGAVPNFPATNESGSVRASQLAQSPISRCTRDEGACHGGHQPGCGGRAPAGGLGRASTEKLEAGSAPAPDAHNARTTWLATVNEDGSPHVTAVGAIWLDGAFWFQTGSAPGRPQRRARSALLDQLSIRDADVVVEGDAARVTDPAAVARVAKAWADTAGRPSRRERFRHHRPVQRAAKVRRRGTSIASSRARRSSACQQSPAELTRFRF